MDIERIVCLSDLLCAYRACAEGFFGFIHEPIRQGCGIDPGWLPTAKKPSGLLPGFSLQTFRELAGWSTMHATHLWVQTWHEAPTSAVDYLFKYVPKSALVLAYDMPPWLLQACAQRGFAWIDIRPSPLAFGRDLYMALHTSDALLHKQLAHWNVCQEELQLEAALLTANLHAHRLDVEEGFQYKFNLSKSLIFVGQHPRDAAILAPNGNFLRCTDFSEHLRELAQGKTVLHLEDSRNLARSAMMPQSSCPWAYAQKEREDLEKILQVSVQACQQNIYQILSADEDVQLVGISAPALQEAVWFGKTGHFLFKPRTPMPSKNKSINALREIFVNVHFKDLLKPVFWHSLLTPHRPGPYVPALPELVPNQARKALNNWGDYEKVMTWQRSLHTASFERSGGGLLRRRIEKLEQSYASANITEDTYSQSKIRDLKDSKKGLTAYVLGNGPSLNELNVRALMDEESFWCNQAYELEQKGIDFRPKYYFVGSSTGFQEFGNKMIQVKAVKKFFRNEVYRLASARFPKRVQEDDVICYGGNPQHLMFEGDGHFSYDPSLYVNAGSTILVEAIQFAFYMGYEKVYVGGVDLDYSKKPYFFGGSALDYVPRNHWTEQMRQSFVVARKFFEKHGRTLAKITKSPNLPLDYFEDKSMRKVN